MTLPYYDRYNRGTGWKAVKFVEGRVVQVPEVNEMQSIAHDNLRQLGNTLFSDGSILEGLQPVVDGLTCNITAGKIYWQGYILDIEAGSVTAPNPSWDNENKIGILIEETQETETENAALNDPVTGAPNLGAAGAYRRTFAVSFTVDDPAAHTLHVLSFGEVATNNTPPQFDVLNQTLALRTKEESGNYLVEGMQTRVEDTSADYVGLFYGEQLDELAASASISRDLTYVSQFEGLELDDLAGVVGLTRNPAESDASLQARVVTELVDDGQFRLVVISESQTVVVEAGVSYVEGYRVYKPSPTRVLVPKAKDSEFVNGLPQSLGTNATDSLPYLTLGTGTITNVATTDIITIAGGTFSNLTDIGKSIVITGHPTVMVITAVENSTTARVDAVITPFYSGVTYYWSVPATPIIITEANKPLADISDIVPVVRLGWDASHVITRGAGGTDSFSLPGHNIVSVLAVVAWDGVNYYPYTVGTDYTVSGENITWLTPTGPGSNTSNSPAQGNSYTVIRDAVPSGTGVVVPDDALITNAALGELTLLGTVDGSPVMWSVGKPNSQVTLDYKFYLPRTDTVYIDKVGKIDVQRGQSSKDPIAPPPPLNTLSLSQSSFVANTPAQDTDVVNLDNRRFTMSDIRGLVTRLNRAEYNQAIENLANTAQSKVANPGSLQAIFTDGFVNFDHLNAGDADFLNDPCSVDVNTGTLSVGETKSEHVLQYSGGASSALKVPGPTDTVFTSTYTSSVSPLSQLTASSAVKVNAYSSVIRAASIQVFPAQTSVTLISGTVVVPPTNFGATAQTVPLGAVTSGNVNQVNADPNTTRSNEIVFDNLSRFILERSVAQAGSGRPPVILKGQGFTALADNLAITIDGIAVPARPYSGGANGTAVGATPFNGKTTVKAAADGSVTAEFDIPASTITSGRKEIKISNGTTENTSTTVFDGLDTIRQPVRLLQQVQFVPVRTDPVAQTFMFTRDVGGTTQVSGVRLFFNAKPSNSATEKVVIVELRETIAGLPLSTSALATKTLQPSQVNISGNASAATDFLFDAPVLCDADKEYAIVVLTNYSEYEVFIARIGENTVNTIPVRKVDNQNAPGAQGVLLTSANGRTWTPDQSADLMYALLKTSAAPTAVLGFNAVTFGSPQNRLQLLAGGQLSPGNEIIWEYSSNASFTTVPTGTVGTLDPTNQVPITLTSPLSTVYVRARLKNSNGSSGAVDRNELKLIGMKDDTTGVYVAKYTDVAAPPSEIQLYLDEAKSGTGTVIVEYGLQNISGAGPITWAAFPAPVSSPSPVNIGFNTYVYTASGLTPPGTHKRVHFRITITGIPVPKARRLMAIIS